MILANAFGPAFPIVVALGLALPLWVIVLLVFTFVLGVGLFLAAFYLVSVRRKLQQQMQLRR